MSNVVDLPIFCYFDKQRFLQFGSMDCANWYLIDVDSGKKKQALYPAMGRKHINFLNTNVLVFSDEPREIFRTINFFYVIVGTQVFQYDQFYNQTPIGNITLGTSVWFAFLAVIDKVYAMLTDETNIYLITESGTTVTMEMVTDNNKPTRPQYIAAFGNRFVVSQKDTPQFYLSTINVNGGASLCFTKDLPVAPLLAQASGVIGQFAVLHGQLYILCDFTTDVWSNIISQINSGDSVLEFPWKLNTSYNWDYGIADPLSLSVDFGRMVWLAKNSNGLVSFMASDGKQPVDISSQAINILLERETTTDELSPFLQKNANGFLYQYENTIFYRVSAGDFLNIGQLDVSDSENSLEYNFETKTWARVIELNGERNRIKKHIYFNNKHLVTVQQDSAIYQMAGNIYYNELRTLGTDAQSINAFTKYPMRYELVTQQLYLPDYAEFVDDYVEIDFVFGNETFYKSNAPFLDAIYIVDETSTPTVPIYLLTEDDAFIILDGSNTPQFDDNHYNKLFKPHIELYYSDDGGVTFTTADLREFSQLGQYRWRMRWYELGASRNRCYRLICVSSAPIIILGGVRDTHRVSGGAN